MIGCRVEPPLVGSPRRPACSFSSRRRRGRLARRAIGQGFDDCRDRSASDVDRQQPDADQSAKTMDPAVLVTATARPRHCQIDLIGGAQSVDGLQNKFERERQLEFGYDDEGRPPRRGQRRRRSCISRP